MLEELTPLLRKLSMGENLSSDEARRALNGVAREDDIGYHYLALTFGIMAKGPTAAELHGFCQSFDDRSAKLDVKVAPDQITDLSGTGGAPLKTFNISTSASFVVAGSGLYVAKQAFRSFTGLTGSLDVFAEFGIDIPVSGGDPKIVQETLEKVGICPYYYPAFTQGFVNRVRFIQKMREIGITFLTPYHLTAFAYAPLRMTGRVYGVFSEKYQEVLARLLRKLGIERGMTVHGVGGLDEVSTIGTTKIWEFQGDEFKEYTISPPDLGLKQAEYEDIKAVSREQNIVDFLRVVYGAEQGPKRDIVLANAAASLYVTGRVKDLKDGVTEGASIVDDGKASGKLEELIAFRGSPEKLDEWKKKAGI